MRELYYIPQEATQMLRMPEHFEERTHDYDWPQSLQALHHAALTVSSAIDELDVAHGTADRTSLEAYGPIIALTGDAYKLLVAIRAEGDKQLAALEAAQRAQQLVTGHDGE